MPLVFKILLASFLSGVVSLVGGIALLGRAEWVKKFSIHFVTFAAGALLATAFLDLLPEAFELEASRPRLLFFYVLAGLLAFFLLERLILKFHSHHYEEGESHHHATPILMQVGDTVHNFIDGVVVAVSFLVNPALGIVTTLAVGSHELPQEIGDFSVMLHHGYRRRTVLLVNLFSSFASLLGAYLGYATRSVIEPYLPILLALAAGHFIYIAAADLIPEISANTHPDKSSHVIALLLAGVLAVWAFGRFLGA